MGTAGHGRYRDAGDVRSAAGETCNRVYGCEILCATVILKTHNLPPTVPELAHCVHRYTARTATLCQTTATAARAGVRMDLIGSRGCGCTARRTHRRE